MTDIFIVTFNRKNIISVAMYKTVVGVNANIYYLSIHILSYSMRLLND